MVLGRERLLGYFAVYLIAVLPPLRASEPHVHDVVFQDNMASVAALVTVPSVHPQKMLLREIGRLMIKQNEIESHFVPGTPPFDFRPQILANALFVHVPSYPPDYHLNLGRFVELVP